MNYHEEQIRKSLGEQNHKPYVSFFDHAVEDKELTAQSGRPRFVERVYIQKIPSAPDLAQRDIFTRAKMPEDEAEYPEEWARYCERKEAVANLKPSVKAIPGMNVAALAELKALRIFNCEDFINYPQPLDELEPLRETARRIMEVSHEVREGRQAVRNAADRQSHDPAGVYRIRRETETAKEESHQKENGKEKNHQEAGQTFSYQFRVRT